MKKILITGCARSGTTLLCRLFYSFKDVEIIDQEIDINQFLIYITKKKVLVGKRTPRTIFSVPLKEHEILAQIEKIRNGNIKLLNIIRDGRDVIHKDKKGYPHVTLDRWIGCIEHTIKYKDLISLNIKYEDLVNEPDKVQNRISEDFALQIEDFFSSYPDFVPNNVFEDWELSHIPNYRKRSIENHSIGHDLLEYKKRGRSESEILLFEKFLKSLDYI